MAGRFNSGRCDKSTTWGKATSVCTLTECTLRQSRCVHRHTCAPWTPTGSTGGVRSEGSHEKPAPEGCRNQWPLLAPRPRSRRGAPRGTYRNGALREQGRPDTADTMTYRPGCLQPPLRTARRECKSSCCGAGGSHNDTRQPLSRFPLSRFPLVTRQLPCRAGTVNAASAICDGPTCRVRPETHQPAASIGWLRAPGKPRGDRRSRATARNNGTETRTHADTVERVSTAERGSDDEHPSSRTSTTEPGPPARQGTKAGCRRARVGQCDTPDASVRNQHMSDRCARLGRAGRDPQD